MIYMNMDFEEYKGINAVNNSTLVRYNQRPDMVTVKQEETEALQFGRNFHTYLLEPEKFQQDIVIIDPDIKVRRGAKWEAFKAQHDGKTLMHQSEYDKQTETMRGMVNSLNSGKYEKARKLIEACKQREVSITWTETATDEDGNEIEVPAKCRLDLLSEEMGLIGDVKTTTTADPEAWIRKELNANRAPHFQPCWYLRGAQSEISRHINVFTWVLFEKSEPYGISVVQATPAQIGEVDMVDLAGEQIDRILPRYISDLNSGSFAGLPDEIVQCRLPPWWYINKF